MTRGRYIAFEGLEGCGKSTHVTRLAEAIGGITTREPGGTAIGSALRAAMLDTNNTMLSPRAEALMMSADRAQHMDELILPTLASGKHVVSDPYAFSQLRETLEKIGFKAEMAEITMKPSTETEFSGDDAIKMQKLLDALENLDDVQEVYSNAVINE
jgi:dTMP kinase